MEKKFTRAMLCEEFGSKCRECPLHSDWNTYCKPCWMLDEGEIQFIMNDYPYSDVKARMIFNDFETRLTAVEKKVSNNVSVEFKPERIVFGCSYNRNFNDCSFEVIDKKLYDKLEEKHEADSRLISEYDLEIKKLEDEIDKYRKHVAELKNGLFELKNTKEERDHYKRLYSFKCDDYDRSLKEQLKCEAVIKDLKFDVEKAKSWEKRYKELEYMYEKKDAECNSLEDRCERLRDMDKERFFDLKNTENERDHYKGLYSSKCDDYDKLLENKIKNEKSAMEEVANYKNLFHSLNHKHQKVVGEMKAWKDKYKCINDDYIGLEKEYNTVLSTKNSLEFRNKDLINENNKLRKAYNDATDNTELEGKLEAKSCRIAALEDKLRYQRANLTSLEKKLKETEEKFNDACILNETRKAVYEANLKLKKIIEAKDREIGLLRAELDKYKTDDECDDSWID